MVSPLIQLLVHQYFNKNNIVADTIDANKKHKPTHINKSNCLCKLTSNSDNSDHCRYGPKTLTYLYHRFINLLMTKHYKPL